MGTAIRLAKSNEIVYRKHWPETLLMFWGANRSHAKILIRMSGFMAHGTGATSGRDVMGHQFFPVCSAGVCVFVCERSCGEEHMVAYYFSSD